MPRLTRLTPIAFRITAALVCLTLIFVPTGVLRADSGPGILYGLSYVSGTEMFVVVDPLTGSVTLRGSGFPRVFGVSGNGTALDAVHHRYYAIMDLADGHNYLNVIDTLSGALLTRHILPDTFGLVGLQFDSRSGLLLALAYLSGVETLMVVNPVTGSVNALGAGYPDVMGVFLDGNTIDAAHGLYYALMGTMDGNVYLHAIDTKTGLLRWRTRVPPSRFVTALQADSAAATIFGIGNGSGALALAAIDTANQNIASRGDGYPGAAGVNSDGSAIDGATHRYFVTMDTAGGPHLFTIDTNTGAQLNDAPLSGPYPYGLEFDPAGS